MTSKAVVRVPLRRFGPLREAGVRRQLVSFDIEVTARCNNNCRHCYINLSAGDKAARKNELALPEIRRIADEAVSMGAVWCLLTGGEPLLREDFFDMYLLLKRRGLLVSIFTNATLVKAEHARFFKRYPPRDVEVSIYGVTRETYERVTRRKGSFAAFERGLNLLLDAGLAVRLKAMALRSNVSEMGEIGRFCSERTLDFYRFDPFLHLRFDGDPLRNEEIRSERLGAEQIVALERKNPDRFRALKRWCESPGMVGSGGKGRTCGHVIGCGAGRRSFVLGYDGLLRLCPSLVHPDCVYDWRRGTLREAWEEFIPKVRGMRSRRRSFLRGCSSCSLVNLCMWCPANGYLETGRLDKAVPDFCRTAEARAEALGLEGLRAAAARPGR